MKLIRLHSVLLCSMLFFTGDQTYGVASENFKSLDDLPSDNVLTKDKTDFDRKYGPETRIKQKSGMQKKQEETDCVTQEEFEELQQEVNILHATVINMDADIHQEQQRQQEQLSALENRVSYIENVPKVAFSAYGIAFHEDRTVSYGYQEIIKYCYTRVNQGGHYSTSTGKFQCPVTGKYFFSFSFLTSSLYLGPDHVVGNGCLVKNGEMIAESHAVNDDGGAIRVTMSSSAVVSCSKGQYIWVASYSAHCRLLSYNAANVFNGMLLYAS